MRVLSRSTSEEVCSSTLSSPFSSTSSARAVSFASDMVSLASLVSASISSILPTTSASCFCSRPYWVWTVSIFDSTSRRASRASWISSPSWAMRAERSFGVALDTLLPRSSLLTSSSANRESILARSPSRESASFSTLASVPFSLFRSDLRPLRRPLYSFLLVSMSSILEASVPSSAAMSRSSVSAAYIRSRSVTSSAPTASLLSTASRSSLRTRSNSVLAGAPKRIIDLAMAPPIIAPDFSVSSPSTVTKRTPPISFRALARSLTTTVSPKAYQKAAS